MKKSMLTCSLLIIIFFISALPSLSNEIKTDPWVALQNLQITKAKDLFREMLKANPGDLALMRGLLLVSYFDLDHETEAEMIRSIAAADATNPYLLAIFEQVAADMRSWNDKIDLQNAIGQALLKNPDGPLKYCGEEIISSTFKLANDSFKKKSLYKPRFAPGCWISGPYDNHNNIAAFREIPPEKSQLDTLAVMTGVSGTRAGWTWLESDYFGDLFSATALEEESGFACQTTFFFKLPEVKEVLILLGGGAYNCRVFLDGEKIWDDPISRNAAIRGGFRSRLNSGMHEVTVVMGTEYIGVGFSMAVRDTNFQPIPDLEWHRYGEVPKNVAITADRIHPIFNPFESYIENSESMPDSRYWKTILQVHNGYAWEAVLELEQLQELNDLTPLELWGLHIALRYNNEEARALEILGLVKKECSVPRIDLTWCDFASESYEEYVNAVIDLNKRYPDRAVLEERAGLKYILENDNNGYVNAMRTLLKNKPKAAFVHRSLSKFYNSVVSDPASALEEFTIYCKESQQKFLLLIEPLEYILALGQYDEAIKRAKKALQLFPLSEVVLGELMYACGKVSKISEVEPILTDLLSQYPYNIELYDKLHRCYNGMGEYDKAQEMIEQIHYLKPSALSPYLDLESLHNGFSYDSIFGLVDAEALWDVTPTEEQLAGNNFWILIDRVQKIVFETGMVCHDVHQATVLLNSEVVESMREYRLGFNPAYSDNQLLISRRLRKGQPPLPGELVGGKIVFNDLRPGDAVEIHYRQWSANACDLWKDFWDTYLANAGFYQRYWEYCILSNRDDINHLTVGPVPEASFSTHCGFNKISFKGENALGWYLDLDYLPPKDDLVGKICVSTLSDWESLNKWYYSVSEAILANNPRSNDLATKLTRPLSTDQDKLKAIYQYIVLDIPYQIINFNYSGSIPHKPDEVLLRRWGDCKDKGHLLITMLRQVGITAWPVLVMTRSNGTSLPISQFAFDHLIVGCIIDQDTIFVDISDIPFHPTKSISSSIAGQPAMQVTSQVVDKLINLPAAVSADQHINQEMMIVPQDDGDFAFSYASTYYNLNAGYRRSNLKEYAPSNLKEVIESAYSEIWSVGLSLDSIKTDSIMTIDSTFSENWFGNIELNAQTIGDLTIIKLPDWCPLDKGLPSRLSHDGKREYPVDLNDLVGEYDMKLVLNAGEELGEPQLGDPVEVTDSLYGFSYTENWNPQTRHASIEYTIIFREGFVDNERFLEFVEKVIQTLDRPIIFRMN